MSSVISTPTVNNTNTKTELKPLSSITASSPSASSLASPKVSPSPNTTTNTTTINNSNNTGKSPVMKSSLNNSPLSNVTGKSPLRSCHTNADAVVQLRRLTAATFAPSSSPTNGIVKCRELDKLILFF